jgi:hypothetical protein
VVLGVFCLLMSAFVLIFVIETKGKSEAEVAVLYCKDIDNVDLDYTYIVED